MKRKTIKTASTARIDSLVKVKKYGKQIQKANHWIVDNFLEFSNTTSLHGFNYLASRDISKCERNFWKLIIITAIVTTLVVCAESWTGQTKTVTVIDNLNYGIWRIGFPSVTLCPLNVISHRKALKLSKTLLRPENMTDMDVYNEFNGVIYFQAKDPHRFDIFKTILEMNNLTVQSLFFLIHTECANMFQDCFFKGNPLPCKYIMKSIPLSENVCCSFNSLPSITDKRQWRTLHSGYKYGLKIIMTTQADDYYRDYALCKGFRVFINDKHDFPDESSESYIIRKGQEVLIGVSPVATIASKAVREMDIQDRQCLFSDERNLGIFTHYSLTNCIAICRNIIIFQKCGCVPITLNPLKKTEFACSPEQYSCLVLNSHIFSSAFPNVNNSFAFKADIKELPCDCKNDCEAVEYETDITSSYLKNSTQDLIKLYVFFKTISGTAYRRDAYTNWLSTLATLGGLMGLIMGASIISLYECIHYLTLRPILTFLYKRFIKYIMRKF